MSPPDKYSKPVFLSRTVLVATINAVLPALFPSVKTWIVNNPDAYIGLVGLGVIVLRLITKDKVTWLDT